MSNVLVVEDEPMNWQVFQRILTRKGGFTAMHTEEVETVLQAARSGEADLILMDVSLNNSRYQGKPIDGIAITRLLKANAETARVPVILVTANGTLADRHHFLAISGADDFIPKPIVDYEAFLSQIRANLPPSQPPQTVQGIRWGLTPALSY